jgi:hypothetical protein
VKLRVNHELGRSVTATAGEVDLFTYVYRPDAPQVESPKPYLHPIRTLAGHLVSVYRPHDHVWHKGIAWSLPYVGAHNFWGGPTFVDGRYVQLPNNGSAAHRTITALTVDGDTLSLAHELDWHGEDGDPVIGERRALAASVVDDRVWVLRFATTMTNVSGGTLAFGSPTTKGRDNAGYGGLFWRGPRDFTGGLIESPDGLGGDELRGERAEWFGFHGRHDGSGERSTVVMVDARDNPRHPPRWFARSEQFACLNPAPFFSEEFDLVSGETITFRYAVVVAAGEWGGATLAGYGREALT